MYSLEFREDIVSKMVGTLVSEFRYRSVLDIQLRDIVGREVIVLLQSSQSEMRTETLGTAADSMRWKKSPSIETEEGWIEK